MQVRKKYLPLNTTQIHLEIIMFFDLELEILNHWRENTNI